MSMAYTAHKSFYVKNRVGEVQQKKPFILTQTGNPMSDSTFYFVESRTKKGDLQMEFFSVRKSPHGVVIPSLIRKEERKETDSIIIASQDLMIVESLEDLIHDAFSWINTEYLGRAYRKIEKIVLQMADAGLLRLNQNVLVKKMSTLSNLKERYYKTDAEEEASVCRTFFSARGRTLIEELQEELQID